MHTYIKYYKYWKVMAWLIYISSKSYKSSLILDIIYMFAYV